MLRSSAASRLLVTALSPGTTATWTRSLSTGGVGAKNKPKPSAAATAALDAAVKSLARVLHPDTVLSPDHPGAAAANTAAFKTLQEYAAVARGEGEEQGVRGGAFHFTFFMRATAGEVEEDTPTTTTTARLVGPLQVRLRPPPPAPGPALAGLGPLLTAAGLRPPEVGGAKARPDHHRHPALSPGAAAAEEAALSSTSLAVSLPAAVARARRLATFHAGVNLEAARVRAALRLVHGARVSIASGFGARLDPRTKAGLMERLASAADAASAALPSQDRPLAGLHIVVGAPGEGGVDAAGAVWLPADREGERWTAALVAACGGGEGGSSAGAGAGASPHLAESSRASAERAVALSLGVDGVTSAGGGLTAGEGYENALDALLTASFFEEEGGGEEGATTTACASACSSSTSPPRPTWPGVVLELDTASPPLAMPPPPGHVRVVVPPPGGRIGNPDEASLVAAVRRALEGGGGAAAQAAAAEAAGVAASGATLREAARDALGARGVSVGEGVSAEEAARGAAALYRAGSGGVSARGVSFVIGRESSGLVEVAPEGGRVVVGWDCEV